MRALDARIRLAFGYRQSERDEEALGELATVVAVRDRTLGADHPDTLATRHELALSYFHAGIGEGDARLSDAIRTMQRAAQGRVRVSGAAHPDTLALGEPSLRAVLMMAYAGIGRTDDAIALAARYPPPEDSARG